MAEENMDAAYQLLKKAVLFSAVALFVPFGLNADVPVFNNPGTVTLAGTGGIEITLTSSGAPIAYTASLSNFQPAPSGTQLPWVVISTGATGTTPHTLGFGLGQPQGSGAFTATCTVTATDGSGALPITFSVNYTSGSSGGGGGQNGTIVATPSSVTLAAAANSTNLVSTTVQLTTSASSVSFAVSTSPSGLWLSTSVTTQVITSTSPATLTIYANPSGVTTSQSGSVIITPTGGGSNTTIPVTFNIGGTGSGGSITANPNPVPWSYNTGGAFPTIQSVSLQTTSGGTTYTATANSTNNWLLVNGGLNVGGTIANGMNLTASSNITTLGTGSYIGTVSISDSNGGSGTLTVNLSVNGGTTTGLTLSPSSGLTFSGAVGSGNTSTQTITITSSISGSLSVSCTPTGSWPACTNVPANINANSPTSITVYANASSLTNGTYNGQFTVTVTGTSTLQGSVPITFIVGTGGGGNSGGQQGYAVAPTSLTFTYQLGTARGSAARQIIGITGTAGVTWTAATTTQNNVAWLNSSTLNGTFRDDGTDSTTISVDPFGLAAGTYTGTLTITTGGGTVTLTVSVTLNVVTGVILTANPGSLLFNYHSGDPTLQPQSVNLLNSDGSTVTGTATTTTSWLTVNQTAGATVFSVTANPSGMGTGMYNGTVVVNESAVVNSPVTVPVVLIINGGGGGNGGSLNLNPTALTFNAALNGASPAAQSISVTSNGAVNFSISSSTTSGTWLSTSQSAGVTPATITVFVNSSGLALGTYTGTITFSANGVNQNVGVTLNVTTTGGGGGNITSNKTSVTFTGQAGGSNPASQTVNITSTSGTAVAVSTTSSTSSGGNWLTITPSGTTTPVVLTVNAALGTLTAGTYNGTITVTPTGGSVLTIPVSFAVSANNTVSASPTTLTFSYRAGDQPPAAQTVNVTGGGSSGGLAFTATASSTGNWLSVTPTSGTTPGSLSVSISPTGLNASATPYTGTITVAGSGTATGSTTVNVSLTVTAPLPTVSKVTHAGSFATSTAISPGEIITLFGTNIGPTTPAGLTLDTTGKVATTIGGVQVLVSGYASPMVYASATQVSAVVPYEVQLLSFSGADILIKFAGQTSNATHTNIATTQPGLFTLNSSGTGPGAILNSNGSVNSPTNPAAKGDVVVLYLSGEGQTNPAGVTGKVTTVSSTGPLTPAPLLPIAILIGPSGSQQAANYVFAGEAPGFVSGVLQLNVQLPATVPTGDQQIIVSIGSNSSQSGVTVSVK